MSDTTSTTDTLHRYLLQFDRLADLLPFRVLGPGEKVRLAGHLFPRDRELIDEMEVALRFRRRLFPDVNVTADELEVHQRAAGTWLMLGRTFHTLGRLAMDNHVSEKAEAIIKCKIAIEAVIDGCNHPDRAPHLDHRRRLFMIMPAVFALYAETKVRTQRRAEKRVQEAERAQEDPARRQRTLKRKQDRRTRLSAFLDSLLASLSARI